MHFIGFSEHLTERIPELLHKTFLDPISQPRHHRTDHNDHDQPAKPAVFLLSRCFCMSTAFASCAIVLGICTVCGLFLSIGISHIRSAGIRRISARLIRRSLLIAVPRRFISTGILFCCRRLCTCLIGSCASRLLIPQRDFLLAHHSTRPAGGMAVMIASVLIQMIQRLIISIRHSAQLASAVYNRSVTDLTPFSLHKNLPYPANSPDNFSLLYLFYIFLARCKLPTGQIPVIINQD